MVLASGQEELHDGVWNLLPWQMDSYSPQYVSDSEMTQQACMKQRRCWHCSADWDGRQICLKRRHLSLELVDKL